MLDKRLYKCLKGDEKQKKWCGVGETTPFYDIDGKKYPCAFITPMTFSIDDLKTISLIDFTNQEKELSKYNISCFVAHEDIEPNEEWLKCIEDALMSMDIMLALVTENFDKSKWTCQEIGFALGRSIPIISIKNGMDPFGFFGKKQAISGNGKMAKDIAKEIIDIIKEIPEFSEYIKTDI